MNIANLSCCLNCVAMVGHASNLSSAFEQIMNEWICLLADLQLCQGKESDKMSVETRDNVIYLLESYHERMNQIALLHYELEHPAGISPDEMIGAMALGHGDGSAHSKGHISNKTLYIALNYQEQTDRMNSYSRAEIVEHLVGLEREQERLVYYISLLDDKQETVIRRFYFGKHTWGEDCPRTARSYKNDS